MDRTIEYFRGKGLSPREAEVAKCVTTGLKNREIAHLLFVEEITVKYHLTNVYKKLGIVSRAQLIVLAAKEHGQSTPLSLVVEAIGAPVSEISEIEVVTKPVPPTFSTDELPRGLM